MICQSSFCGLWIMQTYELKKSHPSLLKQPTKGVKVSHQISGDFLLQSGSKFVGACKQNFVEGKLQILKRLQKTKFNKSNRTSGISSESLIFGFAPEDPLKNLPARKVENNFETDKLCFHLMKIANKAFWDFQPLLAKRQKAMVASKIGENWILPGGLFTSAIVNKNTQLVFHTDNGNIPDCMSVMLTFKIGIEGGDLILPEFDSKLQLENGSAILFDGQSVSHGVEEFHRMNVKSDRFTIVFYALEKLKRAARNQQEELKAFNAANMRKLK